MEEPAKLLAELKAVHHALLEATDGFEAMLRRAAPDAMVLANARLKLISSNGRRHVMLERIYSALRNAAPADAEAIRELRVEGVAAKIRSSEYIALWGPREVMQDWQGYVAASTPIPGSVRVSVRNEQRLLYPLLEALSRAAA